MKIYQTKSKIYGKNIKIYENMSNNRKSMKKMSNIWKKRNKSKFYEKYESMIKKKIFYIFYVPKTYFLY